MRTVLITGADGFIGRNLRLRLAELKRFEVIGLDVGDDEGALADAAARADFVFHLAGVNRPQDPSEFAKGNLGPVEALCLALEQAGNKAPVMLSSSIQAEADNPYGASKRAAEDALLAYAARTDASAYVYRLPNVFGKWAQPNYNSAVATFCHNIARGLPITVNDPAAPLRLVYVDDVIDAFIALLDDAPGVSGFREVPIVHETSVGAVADIIRSFPQSRETLIAPPAGTGLVRALHATWLSYLPPADFDYDVPVYGRDDPRGIFVEMLKTPDAGQFSYFIAHPGVTRGDHYHHSKTEKFLVITGKAHFGFRHVLSGERHELVVEGGQGRIVETIPGWTHNISNIGEEDLVVMLWANEIFDRERPDTISMKV
jgi:UDP-2-acetamido-2,6-beta-L-arabino-hexul-4-ose reductase